MQFTHYTSHIQNNTNSNENSKAAIYTKPKLSHSKLWNQMQYFLALDSNGDTGCSVLKAWRATMVLEAPLNSTRPAKKC